MIFAGKRTSHARFAAAGGSVTRIWPAARFQRGARPGSSARVQPRALLKPGGSASPITPVSRVAVATSGPSSRPPAVAGRAGRLTSAAQSGPSARPGSLALPGFVAWLGLIARVWPVARVAGKRASVPKLAERHTPTSARAGMRAFAARSFGANASVTVPAGMRGSAPALAGGDASASARSTKRALTARFPRWEASAVGLAGSILVSLGAFGAGATLRHDPVLSGTVFSIVRFGHGRLLATAVVYLGIFLLVSAWVRLGHSARAGQANARKIVRTTWMWCVPLLGAPPLFSTDLYTYLAQGVVAHMASIPTPALRLIFRDRSPTTRRAAGFVFRRPMVRCIS